MSYDDNTESKMVPAKKIDIDTFEAQIQEHILDLRNSDMLVGDDVELTFDEWMERVTDFTHGVTKL